MDDESQIRNLVSTWMQATKAGDAETLLSLIAEDALFLTPGRAPLTKADFAAHARAQQGRDAPRIEGRSDIREIRVAGDWAYMVAELGVTVTAPDGSRMLRSGHTLTILRKDDGRWRVARDANLLAPDE